MNNKLLFFFPHSADVICLHLQCR
uniref:Uncharacterized protein n=1 Tax=Anguilla anguilla TaxID=7936 RepID=A0A0E9PZE9_ANGAN